MSGGARGAWKQPVGHRALTLGVFPVSPPRGQGCHLLAAVAGGVILSALRRALVREHTRDPG